MLKNCLVGGKGIVVAADVADFESLETLIRAIKNIPQITGVKVGFLLAMQGLALVTQLIRTELGDSVDIIYDHQKAGNDIPDMGKPFVKQLKGADINAAILFPFTGPKTQEEWTNACFDSEIDVLTGGIMTHSHFLVSEGGYIDDAAVMKIYSLAVKLGCRHFVVPGTKIDWVKNIRLHLEDLIGTGTFSLHAPGFLTQGGDISECGSVAGKSFYPIVGRAIYAEQNYDDMHDAARKIAEKFSEDLEAV